jgi:hypothetical protein
MKESGDKKAQVGHQVVTPAMHKIHENAHQGTHRENEDQGYKNPSGIADQGRERGSEGMEPLGTEIDLGVETESDQGAKQGEIHVLKTRLLTSLSPLLKRLLL